MANNHIDLQKFCKNSETFTYVNINAYNVVYYHIDELVLKIII